MGEIKMVLDDAGYEMGRSYIIEGKYYPRERSKEQMFRGRFKVQLKQGDGELLKENFPTRDSILCYLGEKIPQLKHRVNPPPKGAEGGQPIAGGQGNQGGQRKEGGCPRASPNQAGRDRS